LRFLADENIPLASVRMLRASGHDVAAARDIAAGANDPLVLQLAHEQSRILLTFDRDIGALVFGARVPVPTGVVFFRFRPESPEEPAVLLLGILDTPEPRLEGRFTIMDRERVRQRRLSP